MKRYQWLIYDLEDNYHFLTDEKYFTREEVEDHYEGVFYKVIRPLEESSEEAVPPKWVYRHAHGDVVGTLVRVEALIKPHDVYENFDDAKNAAIAYREDKIRRDITHLNDLKALTPADVDRRFNRKDREREES